MAHSIDTEQAVDDPGIPPENYELAYTNINYLEGSFLFKGVKPVGIDILNDINHTRWNCQNRD